jgi:hypothetical protein
VSYLWHADAHAVMHKPCPCSLLCSAQQVADTGAAGAGRGREVTRAHVDALAALSSTVAAALHRCLAAQSMEARLRGVASDLSSVCGSAH